jgi:hypothetical protein
MRDFDPDGVAQTGADFFEKCPACGEWFDARYRTDGCARSPCGDGIGEGRPPETAG